MPSNVLARSRLQDPFVYNEQRRSARLRDEAQAQRNALADREAQQWEQNAPRREQTQKVDDIKQRQEFLKNYLPIVNDQASLDAMRADAVNTWGQEADDNMPTVYDENQFNELRKRMGIGLGGKEKFSTTNLVYDDRGNAYQVGSQGTVQPVSLGDGVGFGVAPKDRPEYKADVKRATELASLDVKQNAPSSQAERREAQDALNTIAELEAFDLGSIYGRGEKFYPDLLRKQEGIDMMAKRDLVVNNLNLVAAGKLKGQGQITENERLMLQKAATILGNPDISPEMAKQELDRIKPVFDEIVARGGQPNVTPTINISRIPPRAINTLKKNPNMADEFDAYYGAGASAQILGE